MTKKLFILTIALALLTPLQAAKKTKQAQAQEPFGKLSVSISPQCLDSSQPHDEHVQFGGAGITVVEFRE